MTDQHSEIPWREWNAEAFEEARTQDKPVLLDIGAVWCHWCHVMDTGIPDDPIHTGTYSDPAVRQRIADGFIPIKVDNDRRPDINARYNMGGWPTTAFLTPGGEILYGETYVPPDRMIALLDHIRETYRNQKEQIAEQTAQMHAQREAAEAPQPPGDLDPNTAANVAQYVKRNFDFAYGGFGSQPKFPHPAAVQFSIEQYAKTGDAELQAVAAKTLDAMAAGGMYDRYAGGFFRYSTTRDWSVPHFEKMLEDNAKLTVVYAQAAAVLNEPRYLEIVKHVHSWLLSDMYDPENGVFAGSQDADQEERYYGQPLPVRATMPTPYIDRTVYTNWNALAVSSLAARYRLTLEEDILLAAAKTFSFLQQHLDTAHGLRHFFSEGRAQGGLGLLTDQTDYAMAALDLYETIGTADYLTEAIHAAELILATLEDREYGGFYDLRPAADAIGELARPKKEIGDNAEAALMLIRLSALTGKPHYRASAGRALKAFTGEYTRLSFFAAAYARAVEAALSPELHLVVVGPRRDSRTQALAQAAWQYPSPGKAVEILDPEVVSREELAARGYPADQSGAPCAFVCVGTTCLAPATTPDGLREQLQTGL